MQAQTYTKDIGLRIRIGFLLVVLLLITLTFVALSHMSQVNSQLKNIVENNNVKIELGDIMQNALYERALSMHSLAVLEDVFLQDDEFMRFNSMGARYVKARKELDTLQLTAEEKQILSRIRSLTKETQPYVQEVVELGIDTNDPAVFEKIRKMAIPQQRLIAEQVKVLVSLQQKQAEMALNKGQSSYEQARVLMFLLGGIASVLAVLIATFVLRHVTKQAALLEHQALHDELTGLANRVLFQDRLKNAILRGQRQGMEFSIILIDLVRFKAINDSLGHNVGDLLLREVARRLKNTVRKVDTVARLGGDEFVIALEAIDHDGIEQLTDKLVAAMELPFLLAGNELKVGMSMGIASYPAHGHDCATLVNRADIAMYEAKRIDVSHVYYSDKLKKKSDMS